MDIQEKKNTLQDLCPPSVMLAKKAWREWRMTGKIQVVCPKCKKNPEVDTTANGERTTVSCECGFVYNCEINL